MLILVLWQYFGWHLVRPLAADSPGELVWWWPPPHWPFAVSYPPWACSAGSFDSSWQWLWGYHVHCPSDRLRSWGRNDQSPSPVANWIRRRDATVSHWLAMWMRTFAGGLCSALVSIWGFRVQGGGVVVVVVVSTQQEKNGVRLVCFFFFFFNT